MKIGLFFGSFNPVHIGHLIIANYMATHTDMEQVWFVVSPQNPLKNRRNLLSEYDRLEMVNLAIEGNDKLRASDFEFALPKPSFTIDTLVRMKEKYPQHEFVLIMGSDTVNTLPKWKNHEEIINNYPVYVYPRLNKEVVFKFDKLTICQTPMMELSATFIRRCIKNNKSIAYLVPKAVEAFLTKWGYYAS